MRGSPPLAHSNQHGGRGELLFWGLTAMVSAHFSLAYVFLLGRAFNYQKYVYGQVVYPFRIRRLMAWVFHLVQFMARRLHYSPAAGSRLDLLGWTSLLVTMGSMAVAIWATRQSILALLGKNTAWRWMAFLVPYMAYFHFLLTAEVRVQTPYDLPSMAFYSLALWAILARRRAMFYGILIAASFNRETSLFLPFLFFLSQIRGEGPLPKALETIGIRPVAELVAQLAIWEGIHAWLKASLGGDSLLWKHDLPQNLHFLIDPLHWPTLASVFGFLWIPYLLFFREIPNVFLRRCAALLAPWFALMLLFGDLLEIRIQSEWMSYIAICLALVAASRTKTQAGDNSSAIEIPIQMA